jgi:hypothetical protein
MHHNTLHTNNQPVTPTNNTSFHLTQSTTTTHYPLQSQQTANALRKLTTPHDANSVTNATTGKVQEYQHLVDSPDQDVWLKSFTNELRCLTQGVKTHNMDYKQCHADNSMLG